MDVVNIEDVLSMWKEDVVIDESAINSEVLRIPLLHGKYLGFFFHFKRKLAAAEAKKSKAANVKRKYYRGEMTREELDEHGWSQYQGLKPSTVEMNQILEVDLDLINYTRLISDLKTSVTCLEYIMAQLKSREFSLKGIIEYQKWLSGN